MVIYQRQDKFLYITQCAVIFLECVDLF